MMRVKKVEKNFPEIMTVPAQACGRLVPHLKAWRCEGLRDIGCS